MKDNIVISGVSGRLPECSNVDEFSESLFSGVDLITEDSRRWTPGLFGISSKTGKLKTVSHFDAAFFGVHPKQAHVMDPQLRILLEVSFEAIVDAGVNPQNIRGSRTGVFVGMSESETRDYWCCTPEKVNTYGLVGCARAMIANRISYTLDLTGPSYPVDSACSSSMVALQHAFNAIQTDQCDAALVAGINLCLRPAYSLQYQNLNMLSQSGRCNVFDESCDGYVRSEAIVAVFIQKRCDAKRLYATILNVKTNTDGHKPQGIIFPSMEKKKELIRQTYSEIAVNPADVSYVEVHGTGLKAADQEEVNAISEVFCGDRNSPLLIGSVKSNMGHAEPASGLTALLKVILSMENATIAPNIYFRKPNPRITGLFDGRLAVVDKPTRWSGELVGINSFGLGGSNVHAVLEWNTKAKDKTTVEDTPRIAVFSGRTEGGVNRSLEKIQKMSIDDEFISLLHNIHRSNIPGHSYRGFTVLGDATSDREVAHYSEEKRPVWFVLTGMGAQWAGMAKDMMLLPVFRNSIQKCADALKPEGVNLYDVVLDSTEDTFNNNIVNPFIGNAAVQIALVDVLRTLGINPDGIIGHSAGETVCSYVDGSLTAEQTILTAYYRGKSVLETKLPQGAMAAVGLSLEDAKTRMPEDIDIACHNSNDNVTLSGPATILRKFIQTLQEEGIFVKEVNCSEISFHSRYLQDVAPLLKTYLEKVIPHPKKRSTKWISTSVPESKWHTSLAQYSSPAYHINNLLSPVMFQDAMTHIPDNAIVIEVGAHCLLQAILKRALPSTCTNIGLMKRFHSNNIAFLFSSFGKMYNAGLQPDLAAFHPAVSYPVSRGTHMIAPLVDWDHSEEWSVGSFDCTDTSLTGERTVEIDFRKEGHTFLDGHVIDGRILFPAMGYLELVWETFAYMHHEKLYENFPVVFEDVELHRANIVSKESTVSFLIKIFSGSGAFQVSTAGCVAVSGRIYSPEEVDKEMLEPSFPFEDSAPAEYLPLTSTDIYKDLRLRGYDYRGAFKGITAADNQCLSGELTWTKNWVTFIDTMFQFTILQKNSRELLLPRKVRKIIINPGTQNVLADGIPVSVRLYRNISVTKAGGVEIHGLTADPVPRCRQNNNEPRVENHSFIPYIDIGETQVKYSGKEQALEVLLQTVLENINNDVDINLVEFIDKTKTTKALSQRVIRILEREPMIKAECTVVCSDPEEYSACNNTSGNEFALPDSATQTLVAKNIHLIIISVVEKCLPAILAYVARLVGMGTFVLFEKPTLMDESEASKTGFEIVAVQQAEGKVYTILRKPRDIILPIVVQMTERNFAWLRRLKYGLKKANSEGSIVILVSQREELSGIVGLVNCMKQEPGGHNLRCVFIQDGNAPAFSVTNSVYASQLKKDLVMNIYTKNQWGCYRRIRLAESLEIAETEFQHAYIDIMNRGDLTSLRWVESPLTQVSQQDSSSGSLCSVYYAPLNFEDVMFATDTSQGDVQTIHIHNQNSSLGLEFSGRDSSGIRVMGLVPAGGLATTVIANPEFLWMVPDDWSLEEAATVPADYATSYYALIVRGHMQPGETLLVHEGCGGVGQASINIALKMDVTVLTTVGSAEERSFLKDKFPQLPDTNIFNTRDTFFEKHVMNLTRGRGVDLIINSLADDKLQASVRCLANHGRFLDVGKVDIINNSPLGMSVFLKNTAYYGIHLKGIFRLDRREKQEVARLLTEGIKTGVVKPLPKMVFSHSEVEIAFRYSATGDHIGKAMLKIRNEEPDYVTAPSVTLVQATPRTYMNPRKVYIVTEGLGCTGLLLADWLIRRGATKIVLTSRRGITTGYQSMCIRRWTEQGITVFVSTANCSIEREALKFLRDAMELGDIGGIFNVRNIPKISNFETFAEEDFSVVCESTVNTAKHLDIISRVFCPKLDYFVVFSSVSRGRENIATPYYGLANSMIERICEMRRSLGHSAVAIQWETENEVDSGLEYISDENSLRGKFTHRLYSCICTLDHFLRQSQIAVSSLVFEEKKAELQHAEALDAVTNFLGIQELKDLPMPKEVLVKLPSQATDCSKQPPLFLVHPIEGAVTCLEPLAAELPLPVWGLQCTPEAPLATIQHLAAFYVKQVKKVHPKGHYNLGGYSFGATVAFEMALQLEKMGEQVSLFLIDGSPSWLLSGIEHLRPAGETQDSNKDEATALAYFLSRFLDLDNQEVRKNLDAASTCEQFAKLLAGRSPCSSEQVVTVAESLHKKIVAALTYKPEGRFKGSVTLFKTSKHNNNVEYEYDLSKVCNERVEVYTLDGHHNTILHDNCIRKIAPVISLNPSFYEVHS